MHADEKIVTTYAYDFLGNCVSSTNCYGHEIKQVFDDFGRITEIRYPEVPNEEGILQIPTVKKSYDIAGYLTSITNQNSETIDIEVNIRGQPLKVAYPDGTSEQMTYSLDGQLIEKIERNGIKTKYLRDIFGRLKTVSSHDISYFYEYDLLDQVRKVVDNRTGEETRREYFQEELIQETLANGLKVQFTYDQTGRARTLTFPDQTGVEYVYDAVDLKEIRRLIQGAAHYVHRDVKHSLSGQVIQAELPGKVGAIHYGYDKMGHCISIHSSGFYQNIPSDGFDAAGNLLKFEKQNIPYVFTYDDHYQLNSEKGHQTHTYSFDSLLNRTEQDLEKNEHNALNQLIKKGNEDIKYDLNGNLIRKGSIEYTYDSLDRLIKVTGPNQVIIYSYDPFNRRIKRICNGEEELFLYQGQDEIGKWKNGKCEEIRLIGKNKQHRTVAIEIRGIPYVPLHDISGNIAALVNFDGETVEQYRYTAFGEKEILSFGDAVPRSLIGNPWQYAGKRIDEETGLIAFGMRDYDPILGRWMTPDPAGFVDGSNLYAYLQNNPLLYFDQSGLFTEGLFGIGGMDKVWLMMLDFQRFGDPLTEEEIRKLVINCVSDYLKAVNSDEELRPFLRDYPFTANNLKLAIYNYDRNGYEYLDPYIGSSGMFEGELFYYTVDPNTSRFKSKKYETYEEALAILKNENH